MQKYDSTWDGHLGRNTVTKNTIVSNPMDTPSIYSAPYRTGPKSRELQPEEVARMEKAGVAELAVAE